MQAFILKALELLKEKVINFKQLVILAFIFVALSAAIHLSEKYIDQKFEEGKQEIIHKVDSVKTEEITNYTNMVIAGIIENPEVDLAANQLLNDINNQYHFNRSAVLVYHDGLKSLYGVPFIRFSMRYEQINEGRFKVKREKENTINLGYEYIAYFASKLNKDMYYVCNDLEELKNNAQVYYEAYKTNGVKSFAYFLLTSKEDEPIGMLQVFYYDNIHQFTDNEIDMIMLKAQRLSGIMNPIYGNRQKE